MEIDFPVTPLRERMRSPMNALLYESIGKKDDLDWLKKLHEQDAKDREENGNRQQILPYTENEKAMAE